MNQKKSLHLFGWEFSRRGGIEEVSRQVASTIRESNLFDLHLCKYPKSNKLSLLVNTWIRLKIQKHQLFFFMHPYIYEKMHKSFLHKSKSATIVWAHGIEVWGNFGKQHATALPSATKIIASSHFTRDRVLENFPNADVSVAHLAVNTKPCSSPRSSRRGFEILTVGRLAENERYKGHELVIKALDILKSKGIKINYHIVGTGSDRKRLERLTHDLGLSSQVLFYGYLADSLTQELYARCSAFVMPSHIIKRDNEIWSGEGFGLVYLEAALNGLPVIACDEGGQRDCVKDGETGFLVKPHPEMIADRIEWFYSNREASDRMGSLGRDFVLKNYSPEHFKNDILKMISEAFSKMSHNKT
jgi:phosphatidylinositol alpha-1,6-mannosyltransferase